MKSFCIDDVGGGGGGGFSKTCSLTYIYFFYGGLNLNKNIESFCASNILHVQSVLQVQISIPILKFNYKYNYLF